MPVTAVDADVVLQAEHLRKVFGGFAAVDDVSLRVRRGDIHALIGPNGAGKTTCFNLLTGFVRPSAGRILFEGRDITGQAPACIARMGVGRSFQISAVFGHLSVLQNVRVALQRHTPWNYRFWQNASSLRRLDAPALELLTQVGLADDATTMAADLPYGRKRALEFATTLALQPTLMLLDEPTQGMSHEDVEPISRLIRRVAVGRTVLMVEHNMAVVSSIADRITVLARGNVLADGSYAEVSRHPAVLEAYMGRAVDESQTAQA